LSGHANAVYQVRFSPDGNLIATASQDKTLKLWHWDGSLINIFSGHTGEVYSVDFSPDSQTIVSGSKDGTIKLWNLEGQVLKPLNEHNGEVKSVSFNPDGHAIASGSSDRTVKIFGVSMVKNCSPSRRRKPLKMSASAPMAIYSPQPVSREK